MNTNTNPSQHDPLVEDEEDYEENELSYGELYSSALLNGEIIITIAREDEEKTRAGIKNFKNKMNIKLKEDKMPIDTSIISFHSTPSKDFDDCIDLTVVVTKRGSVKVKAVKIPENDLPA